MTTDVRRPARREAWVKTLATTALAIAAVALLATSASSTAATSTAAGLPGVAAWQAVGGTLPASLDGAAPDVQPDKLKAFTLDAGALQGLLDTPAATQPAANAFAATSLATEQAAADGATDASSSDDGQIVSLPDPNGNFERFELAPSQVMSPGLAALHPDIHTWAGHGIDDPTATIHADLSPLGFHASVRSVNGAWYIDPYYHLSDAVYASYYGRDLTENPHGVLVERDADAAELSVDKGYYHSGDTVTVHGDGFAANADVTITISDPEGNFASRTSTVTSDDGGSFDATVVADPDGNLETHIVTADDGDSSASASYQVVRSDDPTTDPPTGDVLRTYRLALITDPGYAQFFGGPANVTAAKVALINRVDQVYEDDMSITMQLVPNNDLLNLNDWGAATAPNGPCGTAACFTQSQVTGCSSTTRARFVIGQIIGASNYDIGHLALGEPGGGVANLGVVGRSNKAGGCTGIPTPVGDFYAIDYVAHEMGHQYSGNHPFNGNQLNCSAGNRNAATSVEPGSGSSIMAYAGICLTDDLQAHSDPYFSQRSQQEISTYTSSTQAAINEVQTASLRHFGGGNEVQVVTFGPNYAPAATIQPLSLAINAAPNTTSVGGAQEVGNVVTIATGNPHTLNVGDSVTISGVGIAGYNGTFTVTSVPSTRSFTYTDPAAGLGISGGGTVTLNVPGTTESGTTVTVTTAAPHGRAVGDVVVISGVSPSGYNGTFTITAVPSARSFQYTAASSGLANGGGGTATYDSPFQVGIGGNDSAVIGGAGLAYTNANLTAAINAIPGFAGTATVTGAASTGFTITYTGASAGVDVPNATIDNLSCGGCFASVQETNHGGALDSFKLNFGGNVSAPIVNGTNYTTAGIQAALLPLLPAGATVTVAAFGGSGTLNNTGFQLTFGGTLAATNIDSVGLQDFTSGASGWIGETDKGGAVDNKGGPGLITPTGDSIPVVTAPAGYTIPLRTPFALTGSATDADGDPLLYSWEQNDRGGTNGTALMSNTKTNGPLFTMFPVSGQIGLSDSLQYESPGENHLTGDPTRVFPDLQQIIDNDTNAETGTCANAPIAPPVPQSVTECFGEFLPTSDYVGFAGVNASPLSLHFRLTARDTRGGTSSADTTLLLASGTGPFLVTAPNTAVTWTGNSTRTVTWNVAGTADAPISATDVKISLSTDGGHTYPTVLDADTANDGSDTVTLPNVATTQARIKVEAVGNVFFDISDANFTILAAPVVTGSLGDGGTTTVTYGHSLSPAVTVSASDADTLGAALTATTSNLPAGLALSVTSTSDAATLPGTRTWTVTGSVSDLPGPYLVTVTVSDADGNAGTTSFRIVVTKAPLTVTADHESRLFGAANPPLTAALSGFVLGQTLATSGVNGSASCTTTAVAFSPPGDYPITCTVGSLSSTSYSFGPFVASTLSVTTTAPCLTGTRGALTVAAGQAFCTVPGAKVNGAITVEPGGAIDLAGANVSGAIHASGATVVRICGSSLSGGLSVSGSTGLVLIGGDAATGPCAGNSQSGAVDLSGNRGGVEFNGNQVKGPVTISGATGTLPPPDTGSVHAVGNTTTGPFKITP
jgi:hypothetical protein